MAPHLCETCHTARAQVLRPKTHARLCAPCFTSTFESEIAATITSTHLFHPSGERVAIGASGGKDSAVLAFVLNKLNKQHNWHLDLTLLSIDEGITGYRDHSLDAVRRSAATLNLPLRIVSYADLYGWSMDQVVAQIGKKGNCTYCGVFRRQALDRGAAMLGVRHVVTGHNADDVAETVVMNLLRGDLPRLGRAAGIMTEMAAATASGLEQGGAIGDGIQEEVKFTNVKRSKPLMFAYEREIVLYAHHMKLDYFSTECIYSPEAFRGSARTLIKNLERIRPESILDVVRSGMDIAKYVPGASSAAMVGGDQEVGGGCGSAAGSSNETDMARMEKKLMSDEQADANGMETEIRLPGKNTAGQRHDRNGDGTSTSTTVPIRTKKNTTGDSSRTKGTGKQKLGQCSRCGYLSSQELCKACVLLDGLNKTRPRTGIEVGSGTG